VVLPDCPPVRSLLADLTAGRPPNLTESQQHRWVHDLVAQGLVVDADVLGSDLHGPVPRAAVGAAYAQHGAAAHDRLRARAAASVTVVAASPWGGMLTALLEEAGVGVVGADPGRAADLVVVVEAGGELLRPELEEWVRSDRPHLVVSNLAARVEVGPLVVPGLTACLGCVDAHRADRDPGRGLVVEQHAHRDEEPCDPLLLGLALAWAARDALSFVEGLPPRTWSASVVLDASLAVAPQEWTRHPRCGCSWGDSAAVG
jgi:hypothetical protein